MKASTGRTKVFARNVLFALFVQAFENAPRQRFLSSRIKLTNVSQADGHPSRFRITKKVLAAIVLAIIIVGSVLVYVYYLMSVASVTTVMIDQVLADRNFTGGTFGKRNATYVIEVRVWSNAQSLSVRVDRPVFLAEIDGVPLGNETLPTGTILPEAYLTYNLRFNINESKAIGTIIYSANNFGLGMTAPLASGVYSQTALITNQVTWNWTTATPIIDYGSCFNRCIP